jgi:small subunit ribosomal protein S2
LAIGRYPVHAEFFDRLLGGPSLPSVFDDRSTALPWRTIGPCGLQGWVDFPGLGALWHLGRKSLQNRHISLLLAEFPLYSAASHTETWLKRPSGGSRAIRLACSHVSARTNRRTQTMSVPDFSMRQLLEAGVHFGHQSHRWNPKMADYIFGERNNIHIIDLAQTVPMLHRALQAVSDTVAKGGRILFVGTKRQAQDGVAEAAKRSAQYFVNSRWLGGTLTNWKTISGSIKRLRHLDEVLNSGDANAYTKKERLTLQRERDKLDRSLGGIKDMGGLPDMIFVIDTNKEDIAIQEAQRLNIPVAAIVDTNSDPKGITYVVPGNDDAGRAISLYCDLVARAAIDGISRAQGEAGIDVGASAHPAREEVPSAQQASGFQGLAGPRGAPDDLKKLPGVSGTIEKKFNDLGIFHYWQLAELDHETAHQIGEEVGLPSRADAWVAQAKALTAEAE